MKSMRRKRKRMAKMMTRRKEMRKRVVKTMTRRKIVMRAMRKSVVKTIMKMTRTAGAKTRTIHGQIQQHR